MESAYALSDSGVKRKVTGSGLLVASGGKIMAAQRRKETQKWKGTVAEDRRWKASDQRRASRKKTGRKEARKKSWRVAGNLVMRWTPRRLSTLDARLSTLSL